MKLKPIFNIALGITTEVLYALFIMLVAFAIGIIILSLKL
jgi:hypothetical protein